MVYKPIGQPSEIAGFEHDPVPYLPLYAKIDILHSAGTNIRWGEVSGPAPILLSRIHHFSVRGLPWANCCMVTDHFSRPWAEQS